MGFLLAVCLASAATQPDPRREYSSSISWSPTVAYAMGNATPIKKYMLVYIGPVKEKQEPRVFKYGESAKASRGAWMFVDLHPDPNDPWQKRWGVKRAPTVVGCDRHGNAFQMTPSLSRAGLQRIMGLVPLLVEKYRATLKKDLAAAIDALESNPEKN